MAKKFSPAALKISVKGFEDDFCS